jgi:hypothetical protein
MRYYEIVVENHLDDKRLRDFVGMASRHLPDGKTLLYGRILDSSSLFSIINKIRDMNLILVSVNSHD